MSPGMSRHAPRVRAAQARMEAKAAARAAAAEKPTEAPVQKRAEAPAQKPAEAPAQRQRQGLWRAFSFGKKGQQARRARRRFCSNTILGNRVAGAARLPRKLQRRLQGRFAGPTLLASCTARRMHCSSRQALQVGLQSGGSINAVHAASKVGCADRLVA